MTDIAVTDHADLSRYEITVDGAVAGFAAYRIRNGRTIVFTHTEIEDSYEGQGLGGVLARGALDDVRARGAYDVVALCPFISAWIARHPDYQDLLAV
jgi:uncharacterized protein